MEITDTEPADVRQIKVTAEGGRASLQVDGIDCTEFVSGYTIHQRAGKPAEFVVQLAEVRTAPAF